MTRNFLHFDSPTPSTHVATRGDTGTPLSFVVGDLNGPWDLTGANIIFLYRTPFNAFAKSDIAPHADQVNHRGQVSGYWTTDELISIAPGNYPCQVKVMLPSGQVRFTPERPLATLCIADTVVGIGEGGGGEENEPMSNQELLQEAAGEGFQFLMTVRDGDGVTTTASILWSDGSTGTYTLLVKNVPFQATDSWMVTYDRTGKVVTQPAVTRDANGQVINQPGLVLT